MISHKGFSFWALIAAAAVILIGIVTGAFELVKLGNIVLGYATVAAFAALWTRFYLTKRTNVDAIINQNPVALALYCGAVVIAGALASTLL